MFYSDQSLTRIQSLPSITDTDIIHSKDLETAIVKIQANKENTLIIHEQHAVEQLLLPAAQGSEEAVDDDAQLSFAERALKRQH